MRRLIVLAFIPFFIQAKTFSRLEQTIFEERESFSYNDHWLKIADTEEQAILKIFKKLIKTEHGKHIVSLAKAKAAKEGKTLLDIVKVGEVSVTDTTLVRKFSPASPDEVVYESRSMVYINKNLRVMDAILDLAHELVHYSKRRPFNPYRLNFSLPEFVASTVEGEGGEVDAYLSECQVLSELVKDFRDIRSNCRDVVNEHGHFDRHKGIQQFYKVGKYYSAFLNSLKNKKIDRDKLPLLSDDEAIFISSAYSLPYPVAAYKEYQTIVEKACDNDQKRLTLLKLKQGRSLASTTSVKTKYDTLYKSYKTRCN